MGILPKVAPGARPCAPPSGCPWSRELLAAPSNGNGKVEAHSKAEAEAEAKYLQLQLQLQLHG
ncbi:hypothetical protein AB4Y92_04965 [Lysobacter sp. TAB13]